MQPSLSSTLFPSSPLSFAPWILCYAVLAVTISSLPAARALDAVSPALIVYAIQDAVLPALLGPFLLASWPAIVSRTAQVAWLGFHAASRRTALAYLASSYTALLAARCASGYILSRSVGWAYPRLFSHTALYEPINGLGPLIVGSILFDPVEPPSRRRLVLRFVLLAGIAFFDGAPWSYACGIAIAGVFHLAQTFVSDKSWTGYSILPITSSPVQNYKGSPPSFLSRSRIFLYTLLGILLSGLFGDVLHTSLFPSSLASTSNALPARLHIVMLTVPRTKDLSSDIMIDALESYVAPWAADRDLALDARLTVYAHLGADGTHPAFERAKTHFAQSVVPMTFYTAPSQAGPDGAVVMSHYLHLADAVQYAYERSAEDEWTMLVEDDFVLCGEWGWRNLWRVVKALQGEKEETLNGGFVGTGGSGLIFPRAHLPTLRRLLLLVASGDSTHIPPDVLLQQCLTGAQPLCPKRDWVISSRLLMGHRGGMLSTGDRKYHDGKWACGWRHPMHGMRGAEVVPV